MTARFNCDCTQIVGETTRHQATHVGDNVWTVSWLPGRWADRHAMTAIDIADWVAENPSLNDPRWRQIEHVLASWNVDPACLDNLTGSDDDLEEDS